MSRLELAARAELVARTGIVVAISNRYEPWGSQLSRGQSGFPQMVNGTAPAVETGPDFLIGGATAMTQLAPGPPTE